MIKKIVVPVDGSPPSVKAVELASDLASKYDAEVILLHVLLRGHMPASLKKALEIEVGARRPTEDLSPELPHEVVARVESESATQLTFEELQFIGTYVLSSVAEICRANGVSKVQKRVEQGDPANVIVQVANELKADAIVMGNRGLSDLQGLLVGSVSHKVSHLARCTCITVR